WSTGHDCSCTATEASVFVAARDSGATAAGGCQLRSATQPASVAHTAPNHSATRRDLLLAMARLSVLDHAVEIHLQRVDFFRGEPSQSTIEHPRGSAAQLRKQGPAR